MRRALALQRRRLAHSQERLQRAEAARSEQRRLAAVIAHDLRAPLHTISVALNLLETDADTGAARPLYLARSAIARAARLLSDLLELSASALGTHPVLQTERVGLLDLVMRAAEEARLRFPARVVQVEEHGAPAFVNVDASRMAQVLDNLISNALLHSPTATTVSVQVCCQDGEAWVSIANEGGIPDEVRARLFQPMNRSETSARRGGLGLGLYIVRRLVAAHGGRVDGEGDAHTTRFRVSLPRA
jgi:signal transduction histidine kinase